MTIKPKWQCGQCGENHEYEDDAADCCRPPRPFEIYVCPHCDYESRSTKEAELHIAQHDEEQDGYIHVPTAKELEAAGQCRLTL